MFFFVPFIFGKLFLNLSLQGVWQALDPLLNDNTLQRIDVYIPNIRAALGAAYLADGMLLILLGIAFKALIDLF